MGVTKSAGDAGQTAAFLSETAGLLAQEADSLRDSVDGLIAHLRQV